MNDLEATWRCAKALNYTPVASSPPRAWWVTVGPSEFLFDPWRNRAQLVELVVKLHMDVQWARAGKVRARPHGDDWQVWYKTFEDAVIRRGALKFKDLDFLRWKARL